MQPDAQASADEWLASAERFAADADYFESDPWGRGVDREHVQHLRGCAANRLRRVEELLRASR